jgi:hypothetical protein
MNQLIDEIEAMLKTINIPKKNKDNNRRKFPAFCRAMTLGYVKKRYINTVELSTPTLKYPKLYEKLVHLGILCNFEFTSIHINHNVVCPKHKDSRNMGVSLIISFGDYTGCDLYVEGVKQDTFRKPVIFDGSKLEHWNTADLVGNRYSLVYYNIKIPDAVKETTQDNIHQTDETF